MHPESGRSRTHAPEDRAEDPRADRIRRIVEDCLCRRAAGEPLADSDLCAAHPDLLPELSEELRTLAVIERARHSRTGRRAPDATNAGVFPELTVPVDFFPGYQLLREIHRGGQGVVYRALQSSTGRKVALKVLLDGAFAGPLDRARFEREIKLLAALRHQNIVTIHDSGSVAGRFYFVMEYVAGRPLDVYMSSEPRSIEQSLRLFLKICDAVNAAHLRGIIHRDLKPANLLVDEQGDPHILDFGLARLDPAANDEEGRTTMTHTGQFVGSLPWAAPEQADGGPARVDMRSDVYSLGVILYQMLTGKFPYSVVGPMHEVVQRIVSDPPLSPRRLRPEIDDDLATILHTCLAKDRERRYQTAGELARDVQRYLHGEPLEAKRNSAWYMLRKSLQRFRLLLSVAALFVVLLAAATTVSISLWRSATQREAEARENLWQSLVSQARATRATSHMGRRFDALAAVTEAAAIRRNLELRNEMIAALAVSDLRPRQAAFAWHGAPVFDPAFERCATLGHRQLVYRVADGRLLAQIPDTTDGADLQKLALAGPFVARLFLTPDEKRRLEVWNTDETRLILSLDDLPPGGRFDIAPDARTIAVADPDRAVQLYDLATGTPQRRYPLDRVPSHMTFDPAGRRLALYHGAFGDGAILDLEDGRLTPILPDARIGWAAAWSPDGRFLAAAAINHIYLWDTVDHRPAGALRCHDSVITHLAISPDGTRLLSRSWDDASVLWSLATQRPLVEINGSFLAFSSDGAIGGWTVRSQGGRPIVEPTILDLTRDEECRPLAGWTDPESLAANQALFAARGTLLLSSVDSEIRPDFRGLYLFEPRSGTQLVHLPLDIAVAVTVAPAAEQVCTFERGTGLCLRNLNMTERGPSIGPPELLVAGSECTGLACSADGRLAAMSDSPGRVVLVDLTENAPPRRFDCMPGAFVRAVSSDAKLLVVTAWHAGGAEVWETAGPTRVASLPIGAQGFAAFSPDDRYLVTADSEALTRWDTSTWTHTASIPGAYSSVTCAPDGTFIAVATLANRVTLVDAATLAELCTLQPPEKIATGSIAVSPDSALVVQMSNRAGIGFIWDLRRIRAQLAPVGLDWDLPPVRSPDCAAPRESAPAAH